MKLHEYQAKELLQAFQIAIPRGVCVETAGAIDNALQAFKGHARVVVKAQIQAGGRGKGHFENGASGIQAVDVEQAALAIRGMLGHRLVTRQTGAGGQMVHKVYVTEAVAIRQEFYVSFMLDRDQKSTILIASWQGGCEIETLARTRLDCVLTIPIDPLLGLCPFQARRVADLFQLKGAAFSECVSLLQKLYRAFVESDAMLMEVNPLVLTAEQRLLALDAKVQLDDNARFRHPQWALWDDPSDKDPREIAANAAHLHTYIAMDGNIACLMNGAGLCMATLDLIQQLGGRVANFLDIGDSASADVVEAALRLIANDAQVKGVFINIFAGTLSCKTVAEAFIQVAKSLHWQLPCVMRLCGNGAQEGRRLLQKSGLQVILEHDLLSATQQMVAAVRVN